MHRESYHPDGLTCRVLGNQRGMALVIVMLITFALTSLAMTGLLLSATRHERVVAVKKDVAGVADADAGIEEGRYHLNSAIVGYLTEDPPTAGWGYYIKPPSGTAVASGSEIAEAVDPAFQAGYTQVGSVQNHSDFYWVKIRHKTESDAIPGEYTDGDAGTSGQIIYYGYYGAVVESFQFTLGALTTASTDHKPIKVIISYGADEAGVNAELAYNPGVPVPAALYAKDVVTSNGTSGSVDGNDEAGGASKPPIVTTSTFTDNGTAETIPDPPGVQQLSPIDIDVAAMVASLKSDATALTDDNDDDQPVLETSTATNPGTYYIKETTAPGIHYSGMTGYGILLVEGDVDLSGGFNWYGIILVTGDVSLSGGGGPNQVNIHGAILAGGEATVSGNVDFNYNSDWANDKPFAGSPNVLKWAEL